MSVTKEFRTAAIAVEKEIIIKRSRFISYITPVETVEKAQEFVDGIRKKHWDATHNVPAWRVGHPVPMERFSDDGEPAGTAGMPVLEVLRKQDLTNTVVVVTRYFGGVLLGAGGLVRAYTDSVVQGLAAAGIKTYALFRGFSVETDYSLVGQVLRLAEELDAKISGSEYGATVTISGWLPPDKARLMEKNLMEISQGQLKVTWGKENFLPSNK